MLVIGVDCATDDARTGLARGEYQSGALRLDEVHLGSRESSAAAIVTAWLRDAQDLALLAMDAPLGWPAQLGRALVVHRAGQTIDAAPNDMFRRVTDRFIQQILGKTPLDVGADRIARTAHAALRFLGKVRQSLGVAIPLAWSPRQIEGIAAIEVYPAATLAAHGLRSQRYKGQTQTPQRRELVAALRTKIAVRPDVRGLELSVDVLDAIVCLLAAKDFLDGHAIPPTEQVIAEQEGWIWVAPPVNHQA